MKYLFFLLFSLLVSVPAFAGPPFVPADHEYSAMVPSMTGVSARFRGGSYEAVASQILDFLKIEWSDFCTKSFPDDPSDCISGMVPVRFEEGGAPPHAVSDYPLVARRYNFLSAAYGNDNNRYCITGSCVRRADIYANCRGGPVFYINGYSCRVSDQHSIRLSNDADIYGAVKIAEVEPGNAISSLRAQVINRRTGESVAGVPVKLKVDVTPFSGGHQHNESRPNGGINGTTDTALGTTQATGFPFSFIAPAPAGEHKITASCTDRTCTQEGPNVIEVKVPGLVSLGASGFYGLIGVTGSHPDNHYLTLAAREKAGQLARRYRELFPTDPVLQYNDASLVWGGLFDISGHWQPPHREHRRGTVIDVRANGAPGAIPSINYRDFTELAEEDGAHARLHSLGTPNQHFHVRLMGVAE